MIYKVKATIPISKVFMREFAVRSNMNLFRFNRFLMDELCFSSDQMVIYKAYDSKGVCTGQYGMFDLGDGTVDKVTFADLAARDQTDIVLVYDLRSNRVINLAIEGEIAENPHQSYPATIAEKGHNPSQFADKYEDYLYEKPVRSLASALPDEDDDDEDDGEEDDFEQEEIYDGEADED